MSVPLLRLAPLVALLAAPACSLTSAVDDAVLDGGAPPDDGVPDLASVDLATLPDLSAENTACEAALAADWRAHPPTTVVGRVPAAAAYQAVVGKIMADYQVPGGAVAVTQNGKLVLAQGLGFADVEGLQPAHPDQLFRIASLSKQITAGAILTLVAAGKLSLDEPAFAIVNDLSPLPGKSVHPALASVTVRHLLNHTGGWNRDFEAWGDPMFDSLAISAALGQPGPASCTDTIRYMLDKAPTYGAGTTTCYSNFGYCVLGRIIERRSGAAYEDYVKASVLPASARRMRLGHTLLAGRADDEVRYYPFAGEGQATSVFPAMPGMVPWEYGGWAIEAMDAHGGWIASPIDQLRYALTVDGLPSPPDLVDAPALAQMLGNPHVASCNADGSTTPEDPAYWYGFGFAVNKFGNHWHLGSLDGTSTEDVTAASGYSWAAFFNSRPADSGGFGNRLDADLWTALGNVPVGGFGTEDYFDQFPGGGPSAWAQAATFAADYAGRSAGQYPVRLEGRLGQGGVVELRAEWAPRHGSTHTQSAWAQDCLTYRNNDATHRAQGLAPVAIQSFTDAAGHKVFQSTWAQY